MKKKIIIISGDPNSINSEIIAKCWKNFNNELKKRIFIISNFNLLNQQFNKLGFAIKLEKVNDFNKKTTSVNLKIIDLQLNFKNEFNVSKKNSSKFVIESLNLAHKLTLRPDVSGLINCAISKDLLNKSKIGVTEYLANKCNLNNNSEVMMIRNKNFSVSPITTHIDIKDVPKQIKKRNIINKVKTINSWYKKKMRKKPKIGILGLNPHNAEYRKNSEEKKIISPSIKQLKKLKIDIHGPLVPDTIFMKDFKKFDVIIGMYHDQVLTPFKSLFKFDAINVTLGLKYLRASPDHGVAIDLINKNKASSLSLLKCINFINKFGK